MGALGRAPFAYRRMNKDAYGPEYVLEVFDPFLGMEGFLVVDNTALGPGKGGIRMTENVTVEEVFRLARAMTWKNALAEIPFGGAKAGIRWPGGPEDRKRAFVESFARKLKPFLPRVYIAGPDVNTGEREMKQFVEAAGNWRAATGKPADYCMAVFGKEGEKCGLPHEFGSTGFGVAVAARTAAEFLGEDISRMTASIDGFGNVGSFTFRHLQDMGVRVVAVSDKDGAAYDPAGLDLAVLEGLKREGRSVKEYGGRASADREAVFSADADILIPASVTDVIHEGNKDGIRARIIVEGANIPMQESVERDLASRGILIIPDIVANAGGVISSYAEYRGYNPKRMFAMVERKISSSCLRVLKEGRKADIPLRDAAMKIAEERVRRAMAGKKKR